MGRSAKAVVEGEFHCALAIEAAVPGLVPKPVCWGEYHDGETRVFFFLGDFRDMDFDVAPKPAHFASQIAELHQKGVSPNGMFGFHVPTVLWHYGAHSHMGKELGKIFHPPIKGCHQIRQ